MRAAEELDDKTEHLLTLAVAGLAGAVTLGLFAARQDSPALAESALAALVAAGGLNLVAVRSLLGAYNVRFAPHRPLFVGPDPTSLERASRDGELSMATHLRNVIAGHASYHRDNHETMTRAAKRRAIGLHLLVTALVGYATAFVLIAGAQIWPN